MKLVNKLLVAIFFTLALGCQREHARKMTNDDFDKILLGIDDSLQNINNTGEWVKVAYDSLLQLANSADLSYSRANILRRYGVYYMNIGRLDSAVSKEYQSLEISHNSKDSFSYWSTYNNIGGIYQYFKMYDSALSYYLPTYDYANIKKDELLLSELARCISMILSYKGDNETATEYSQVSLNNMRKLPAIFPDYKFDSTVYWIQLLKVIPNDHPALVQQSISTLAYLAKNDNNPGRKGQIYSLLAWQSKSRNIKGENYLDSFYKYNNPTKDFDKRQAIGEQLLNYYSIDGPLDSVLKYSKEIRQLEDSVLGIERFRSMANSSEIYKKLTNQENALLRASNSIKTWIMVSLLAVTLMVIVAGIFMFLNSRQKQKLAAQELALKNAEITRVLNDRELSIINAALDGQDKERSRIASELHDGIGSNLSIAKVHFSEIEDELKVRPSKNPERYAAFASLIDKTMQDVRRISHDLYGSTILKFGLKMAVQELAEEIKRSSSIVVNVYTHDVVPLGFKRELHLYRIIQELISNSLKYASPSRIDIQLLADDEYFTVQFEDDGKGFDVEAARKAGGMGMKTIEGRANELNGQIELSSHQDKGMFFMVTIPVTESNLS